METKKTDSTPTSEDTKPNLALSLLGTDLTSAMRPYYQQREFLFDFMRQNRETMETLGRTMSRALESYRELFSTFGTLREQIIIAQKEREALLRSVGEMAKLWNLHVTTLPPVSVPYHPVQRHENTVVTLDEASIEAITDKVIEKLSKRARSETPLLGSAAVIQLPDGTRWESISFEFQDETEAIIRIGKKSLGRFGLEELGFAKKNTRDKKHNKAWNLLLMLSTCKIGKAANPSIETLLQSQHFDNRNMIHTTKLILSKHLGQVFGIGDDPFFPYSEYGYYQTRFTLLPPVGLRGKGEVFLSKKGGYEDDFRRENDRY